MANFLLMSAAIVLFSHHCLSEVTSSGGQYTEPLCDGKQVIVHLFEWPWESIAKECEEFLGPKGYCGVQVSPPNEHIQGGQWWTRYQPVSYMLQSRSGSREQFADMVKRCNAAGVNVIVDMVINHMSSHGGSGTGSGGSGYDGTSQNYPGVPFSNLDFHQPYCEIGNQYHDANIVRNCYLVSLNDLNGGNDYVRQKIADYANDLIGLGVKGFRIDASKHMWPQDLENIESRFNSVDGTQPFVFHEVIDMGNEPIKTSEYYHVGKVTEFRAGTRVASCIRGNDFNCLRNFGNGWSDGLHAVVFVDNHDTQRSSGDVMTYKDDYNYKLGVAFLLAQEYGFKRVMSSYFFNDKDQGPPGNAPGCFENGWVCEHRWSTTMNMVQFANAVAGNSVENWQVKDGSLGFSRGNVGFFAMGQLNNVEFYTGLPDGDYCDLIHECKQTITVSGGNARFSKAQPNDPIVAICVGCRNDDDS